jgi:uncharacterized protein (TIGR03663 family)
MHTDEAVHALKFGALLETGAYRFDPREYHGPALYYFTLVSTWFRGERKLAETDETTLRIVPAVFGTGLVVLFLFLSKGLGRNAAMFGALFTAVSPAMVFYSRYYIHEMLFVFFTFGMIVCGYRYLDRPTFPSALSAGTFAGLMHATKETCVIPWAAVGLYLAAVRLFHKKAGSSESPVRWPHVAAGLGAAVLVSILFYSSFFTHPKGVLDSVLTYGTVFGRASQNSFHVHPWYYYFRMLGFWKAQGGPAWSEGLILLLSLFGVAAAFSRGGKQERDSMRVRFLAAFAAVTALAYSMIPYKTPWNMLVFLQGLILLAGVGAAFLLDRVRKTFLKTVLTAALIAGAAHLAWQSLLAIGKYDCDPKNPYVYAHPGRDVINVSERVHRIAKASLDGLNIYVEVIFPKHEYWPLPWYFRDLPNTGWTDRVDAAAPPAPVILTSPVFVPDLIRKMYEIPKPGERHLYVPLFDKTMELRPGAEIAGYARKEALDGVFR